MLIKNIELQNIFNNVYNNVTILHSIEKVWRVQASPSERQNVDKSQAPITKTHQLQIGCLYNGKRGNHLINQ